MTVVNFLEKRKYTRSVTVKIGSVREMKLISKKSWRENEKLTMSEMQTPRQDSDFLPNFTAL